MASQIEHGGRATDGSAVARTLLDATAQHGALPPGEPQPGDVVGRHVLQAELGRGGMARVFAAYDAGLDRTVAIKFVTVGSPRLVERFLREARDTARCVHPNIVVVHEIGQHHQVPYMVLERVEGESLARMLRRGPLPLVQVVDIMLAVARALECAHAQGIVHRDLKPSNILVTRGGIAKVCDFGVAAYARELRDDATAEPTGGARDIAGTLPYMAPEQVAGRTLDARADLWSFGVVLHQLLVRARPFDGRDEQALRAELAELDRSVPALTRGDVPPLLRWLVARCLEKPRAHRLRAATEAVIVLQQVAEELAPGRPAANSGLLPRQASRARGLAAVAGIAALIAVGVAVTALTALIASPAPPAAVVVPVPIVAAATPPPVVDPAATDRLAPLEREVARLAADGYAAEAEQVFATFVSQPDNAAVRAEAWLRRGDRELAAAPDLALRSYATGYAASSQEADDQRALVGVARSHLATWRWDALAELAPMLATSPERALHAEVRDRAALALRRGEARDATAPVIAQAARALLQGSALPHPALAAHAVDLDGDGAAELVIVEPHAISAWRVAPALSQVWRAPLDEAARAACVGSDAYGALIGVLGARTQLYRLDASGAHLATTRAAGRRCALVDLDRDGLAELYVADDRELVRIALGARGRATERRFALGSVIGALVGADLDGDGRPELAIATGEWRAYDVRVLCAAPRGGLEVIDRVRLGRVSELGVARVRGQAGALLVARKDSAWPSAVYLPAAAPAGGPDGLYLLALVDGALRVTGQLPDRRPRSSEHTLDGLGDERALVIADLDGDGSDELLAAGRHPGEARPFTEVWSAGAEGWASAVLDGVVALAAVELHAGRAATLARVLDGDRATTWLLGEGRTPVPPIEVAPPPTLTAPAELALPGWIRAAWARADVMSRLGATEAALGVIEPISRLLTADGWTQVAAQLLALRHRAGLPTGPVWDELAERAAPGAHARAQLRAAKAYASELAPADAVRALDAALDAPPDELAPAERADAQAARARLASETVAVFDGGALGPAWQIGNPIAIRRVPADRRLQLEGFGTGPIAALPLARTTGPIGVAFEGTITRAEWGAGISIRLAPRGAERWAALGVHTTGGGGLYEFGARWTAGARWGRVALGAQAGVDARLEVSGSWIVQPDAGEARWTFVVDGVCHTGTIALPPTEGAEWQLTIEAEGQPEPSRIALALTRLEVTGLAPVEAGPTARDAALRALVDGDAPGALAAAGRGAQPALIRGLAALRQGDAAAGVAALRELRAALPRARAVAVLAELARVDDAAYAAEVRRAAGPDEEAVLTRAWRSVVAHHPHAEVVQRALLRELRELGAGRLDDAAAVLVLARAAARAAASDRAGATRDLEQILEAGRRGDVSGEWRAEAELARARLAASSGAPERARRAVLAALAVSPWPESTADRVLLDDALAPLAARPDWERVRQLGRPLTVP